jgi:hypothetical protein
METAIIIVVGLGTYFVLMILVGKFMKAGRGDPADRHGDGDGKGKP